MDGFFVAKFKKFSDAIPPSATKDKDQEHPGGEVTEDSGIDDETKKTKKSGKKRKLPQTEPDSE